MDNRKRILVVVLIVMTVLLGGASILISQLLQNTQAPTDSSASGFGTAVNKAYFDEFEQAFLSHGCFGLISDSTVNAYAPSGFDQIVDHTYAIENKEPKTKNPVNCTITLDDSAKQIELSVYTYDQNSGIDTTADSLFSRVNANISSVVQKAVNSDANYFFGTDTLNSKSCRLNFFNSRNDFEYITLEYKNFNDSCSNLKDFNTEMSYVLGKSVDNIINYVLETPVSFTK